jgi:signal peptide peptidase SppA
MSRHTARMVLDQISNRPALIAPKYAHAAGVADRIEVSSFGAALRDLASADVDDEEKQLRFRRREMLSAFGFPGQQQVDKPFLFAGGKAIIPIHGLLLNRFPYSWSFATGYNFIQSQVNAAMDDGDVDGIVYDVNSYGGLVTGCQETSDLMYAASAKQGGKPSLAVVDANCYSAAYYLASAADRIVVTPSGGAGSVGVVLMHVDMSKALDEAGVKVTFISAGDHKVDGNAYEPLSTEVAADLKAEIDKMYGKFVSTVARNRPNLSEQAVRDTEARIYQADDALALGLIDAVQTPPDALQQFFSAEDASDLNEDTNMATPAQQSADNATAADNTAAVQAAAAEARTAERQRIAAIHALPEAEGRTELATHLALNTDMTPDAAKGILGASPKKETQAAPPAPPASQEANHFKNAMNADKHPNVGADSTVGSEADPNGRPSRAQQILSAQRKAMGTKEQTQDAGKVHVGGGVMAF